jgi:tetratricopeptide (TPR) repeat protein
MKPLLPLALVAALVPLAATAVETYQNGGVNDPQVRLSSFLDKDKQHFSAIVELLQVAGATDPMDMPAGYQWRLADNYLGFGMRDRAEAMYRNLAAIDPDPKKIGQAYLRLAELDYERGYTNEARATLYRIREKLPKDQVAQWQDLLSRVLMAQGRYSEAADVLHKKEDGASLTEFMRYNLGIALLNSGRPAPGQTALDDVGTLRPDTDEDLALRDRANLTLGWQFLQTQQSATAKPVLSRVRIEGPFSNRALLGLGWAQLSPQGSRNEKTGAADGLDAKNKALTIISTLGVLIRPGYLDQDVFDRAGIKSFRRNNSNPEGEAALRRALVPWLELTRRDPMDPAVQEAYLAIPYALDRLGAHTEALQYYEKAIGILEDARKRMDTAMYSIRQGRMVETIVRRDLDSEAGWEWKLHDLPDAPETYFLQSLLAEHRFQEALKNYRDLRMLSRNIEGWRGKLQGIQQDYLSTERKPADTDELLRMALRDAQNPYPDTRITLRLDARLRTPGSYDARPPAVPAVELAPLAMAPMPARFDGAYERAQQLQTRIDNLRSQLTQAGADQAGLLQDMAIQELAGQREQIERYLIEARFALARLYDRAKQGDQ